MGEFSQSLFYQISIFQFFNIFIFNINMFTANNDTAIIVHEAINDEYEWIQYNSQLRIIRSVNDDMYQMQSIIKACNSDKLPKDWFKNESTQELIMQFNAEKANGRILPVDQAYENRTNLSNGIRGYYVHRLLVNAVAMWSSPSYAFKILILLDSIAREERAKLEQQITQQKPRMVPKHKEKNYKYMIYKENETEENVLLQCVRRNNHTFRQVSKIQKSDRCWFYREELPIAMTPNEDVKDIVRETFPGKDYRIDGNSILIRKKHLPQLHQLITNYFDSYQE